MESSQRQIKERIGVVLDDGYFYDELTLSEMKSIIAPAYKSWCEEDFKENMVRFSLNPRQKISTLSKGMRMKYSLALALSHKAQLLIMDEPTSGLDPLIRSHLLSALTDFMSNGGKGVFFSTHITSDLDKIADMIVMIDHGSILFQEEKDSLTDNWRIVKGDIKYLDDDLKKLFINLTETSFGFTGLTNHADKIKAVIPSLVMERASIEDIMLGYMKRGVL